MCSVQVPLFSEGREGDRVILDQEYECVPRCFFTVLVNIVNLVEQRDAQEIIRHFLCVCSRAFPERTDLWESNLMWKD